MIVHIFFVTGLLLGMFCIITEMIPKFRHKYENYLLLIAIFLIGVGNGISLFIK